MGRFSAPDNSDIVNVTSEQFLQILKESGGTNPVFQHQGVTIEFEGSFYNVSVDKIESIDTFPTTVEGIVNQLITTKEEFSKINELKDLLGVLSDLQSLHEAVKLSEKQSGV